MNNKYSTNKIYIQQLILVLILAMGCSSSTDANEDTDELGFVGLKTLADHPVGVAIQARHLDSSQRTDLITGVFDRISAEYEMKPVPIWTGPDSYNWAASDALVDFAGSNGMTVHGHTLAWHQTTPSWLAGFSGDDTAFEAVVEDYISTVMQRYAGRVVSWDVVNEAFADASGQLRNSIYRQRMGDDYIAKLFEMARTADPNALLFYNDYGTIWDANKRNAMFAMIDDLQARGVPIDGVGLQMHITYDFPTMDAIIATMDAIAERGLLVHISELDVRINALGDLTAFTRERGELQAERIRDVVAAYNQLPAEQQFGITMWGLADSDSWLINFWGNPEWPLLFNDRFNPKLAYEGFVEALEAAQ